MKPARPRISLLSLAEYMYAPIERRSKIVATTLEANEAAAARYSRARIELVQILQARPPHDVQLADAAKQFREAATTGEWDESDRRLSAAAFDTLRRSLDGLRLGDRPARHRSTWPLLWLEGVGISVSPDLIVRELGGKVPSFGGVKFRFGSRRALGEEEGLCAATVMRFYLHTRLKDPEQRVAAKLCQVVDTQTGKVFKAPNAYIRLIGRVRLACEEFRGHWRTAQEQVVDRPSDRPQPVARSQR